MDAHRLKTVRKKCSLTQETLAKASGVPVNTVRTYEHKSKDLNKSQADIIMRLTRTLRCEISDLLG
jgi:DNA-binding XRE family transcriptional regulator